MKKKTNFITAIIILVVLVGGCTAIAIKAVNEEPVEVQFDILEYVKDGRPITEKQLIKKLGKPESSETWKKEVPGKSNYYYDLKTLTYDNGEKEFIIIRDKDGSERIARVTLYKKFNFKDYDDLLPMFHLIEFSDTKVENNKVSYRAKNLGVHDFWIPSIEENEFKIVKFTFYKDF